LHRYNAEMEGDAMTTRLERAFAEAAKLPIAEQELLASRLIAELAAEDDFDRAIAASGDKLARLATEALAEHRAGLTEELDLASRGGERWSK
jgi:hypothetical protein